MHLKDYLRMEYVFQKKILDPDLKTSTDPSNLPCNTFLLCDIK